MSELDDFFAKKDRKKSKGKKFLGSEEKVKSKSEESSKTKERIVKKERIPREDGEEGTNPVQEADEWREFEEEKKDYSGLKLGHLSISNNPEGGSSGMDGGDDGASQDGADGDDGDCNTISEGGSKQSYRSGPWKRVDHRQQKEKPAVEQKENGQLDKKVHEEEAPKRTTGTGAYVPPGLRNLQMRAGQIGGGGSGAAGRELQSVRMRGARVTAPDIHNEDYFPTLAAGGPGGVAGKDKQGIFEVVSHGRGGSGNSAAQLRAGTTSISGLRPTSSSSAAAAASSQQLALGNRFNTLSHSDS